MNNESLPVGKIPPGIAFGNQVLHIPALSYIFRRGGHLENLFHHKHYTWIKHGEVFAKYSLPTPKTRFPLLNFFLEDDKNEFFLQSPVDGLIINPYYNYDDDIGADYSMSILLPDDEPPAENGHYLFSDLCNFSWERRAAFLKPRFFMDKGAFTEDFLKKCLDEQQELSCKYIDAIPEYDVFIQGARTSHSHLRPYLKHLR